MVVCDEPFETLAFSFGNMANSLKPKGPRVKVPVIHR